MWQRDFTYDAGVSDKGVICITVGGVVIYVGFVYMLLPAKDSIIFGIAGGIVTVLMSLIVFRWTKKRDRLPKALRSEVKY